MNKWFGIAIMGPAFSSLGCGGGMDGACTELEGKRFESLAQLECGLGMFSQTYRGTYDEQHQTIVWEGEKYALVAP